MKASSMARRLTTKSARRRSASKAPSLQCWSTAFFKSDSARSFNALAKSLRRAALSFTLLSIF
uniref:Uncharacterized protein n=1 Tax=Arundo donax TaxID=35708 RepID=A0A0A9F8B9_ARUDO